MTHNGKIGRLPKAILEQLNRRLDDGEPGKDLVTWLNSLPEVQKLIQTHFDGKPIRPQNLSEWKKRGYLEWQRRQERLEFFQQLQTSAEELGKVMDPQMFQRQYSMILMADLALSIREIMDTVKDPQEKAEALGELAGRFAQLRKEESNAVRTQVTQEKWDRERPNRLDEIDEYTPHRAVLMHRMYLEKYGRPRNVYTPSEKYEHLQSELTRIPTNPFRPNPSESE